MTHKECLFCHKEVVESVNYCSWDCHIEQAKADGGEVYTPNNLPVKTIRYDGMMLEHEHGDHPTYIFPVDIKYIAMEKPPGANKFEYNDEVHALIYTDGNICLTMYETTYAMWDCDSGNWLFGSFWSNDYCMSAESARKAKQHFKNSIAGK